MLKLVSPIDQVDSYPGNYTRGSVVTLKDGNEYIYLDGVVSTAQYDWVTYATRANSTSYGSVTRLAANAIGSVGIAQAAITNNKCGWFLIKGVGWGNAGGPVTSGTALFSCGTTATVCHYHVAGDLVLGATALCAATSGGTVCALLNYPFVTNALP